MFVVLLCVVCWCVCVDVLHVFVCLRYVMTCCWCAVVLSCFALIGCVMCGVVLLAFNYWVCVIWCLFRCYGWCVGPVMLCFVLCC